MVFAAIDVGSNTLRLLVAEVIDGNLNPLRYERVITRLARGLKDSGVIGEDAARMSAGVLKKFADIVREMGASTTRCVGTSVLREAHNSAIFKEMSHKASGFEIETISGEEEASLTALGVLSSIPTQESYIIFDIGGGSTELVYSFGLGGVYHMTKPVGVVKMAETYMRSDPPSEKDIEDIWSAADMFSREVISSGSIHADGDLEFIGTAGTANTIAAIDLGLDNFDPQKVHNHKIRVEGLWQMLKRLKSLTLSERSCVKGLEPQRADLIIPGIILTISLMECIGLTNMRISSDGLLEGIVRKMAGEGLK